MGLRVLSVWNKTFTRVKWRKFALFLFVLFGLAPFGTAMDANAQGRALAAGTQELAVIAGKSFPVDSLNLDVLQGIYLGEKEIFGNVRLKPVDQRDNQEIKSAFLSKVLHLSREGYITYWNNRLFREGGIPPIPKRNSEEVILTVEETSGAIGYVLGGLLKRA